MGIVDASYQPWTGPLQGRLRRVGAMLRPGFALALDGGMTKVMLLCTYAMSAGFIGILYIAHVFGRGMTPFALGNTLYRDYLGTFPGPLLVMLLTAVVGGRLISRDIRTNATAMYFSKAITRYDYLAGKLGVLSLVLLSGTFLPAAAIWVGEFAMGPEEITWAQRLGDLGSITLHSLVIVISSSAVILALSSLGKTAYVPGTLWILLHVGTWIIGRILVNTVKAPWCKMISWSNLSDRIGEACYAVREVKTRTPAFDRIQSAPSVMDFPWWVPGIVLGAITLISLAIVLHRLHALEKRE